MQILDYGVDDGVPYIAMEMLEGESLAQRLQRLQRLPYAETARFVTHIARALANRPALLLADEPTGELDARTGREIVELLGRLNADGTTIVVVTHDESLARAARRVVHMRDGEIVQDGVSHG